MGSLASEDEEIRAGCVLRRGRGFGTVSNVLGTSDPYDIRSSGTYFVRMFLESCEYLENISIFGSRRRNHCTFTVLESYLLVAIRLQLQHDSLLLPSKSSTI